MKKQKRGMGRPPREFTQVVGDRICEQIVAGKSLRRICQAKAMPSVTTVMKWLREDPDFASQYARAREEQADGYADELIDLAKKANEDNAQAIRVRADIIKWVCSKLKPRKYGDRLELQGGLNINPSVPDPKPIAQWTRDEKLAWMRDTCFKLALLGRDLRDEWQLEHLAEGYGYLGTETWKQVLAVIEGRRPTAPVAGLLPAPRPPEREINPAPAEAKGE